MSWGKSFISAVLAEGSVSSLLQFGPIGHLFRGSEIEPFNFVIEFVKEYGKLPAPETILAHTSEELTEHVEPAKYYHDAMVQRHMELEVKNALKQAQTFLGVDVKNPEAALKVLAEVVMRLMAKKFAKQVVDFREAYELVWADYLAKKLKADKFGLQFGWPYLDAMTGGMVTGDVISFVGRPAAGKTWKMLYGAHHGWAEAGITHDPDYDQSRMFVSMEVNVLAIEQRLAAMQTHLSASHIKHAALGTVGVLKLKQGLLEIKGFGAPFYVVDGNLTATVADIAMMARQLKPAGIFIDGGYLLQHPTERDRFKRVAENCHLLKSDVASIAPTVVSWQFAKTAAEKKAKKKGEPVGLEDIGYSDAIAQVSSVVLGIFEDDNVETIKTRNVRVLKGRNGETGEFRTHWNFAQMDFSQVIDEAVEDMQFI